MPSDRVHLRALHDEDGSRTSIGSQSLLVLFTVAAAVHEPELMWPRRSSPTPLSNEEQRPLKPKFCDTALTFILVAAVVVMLAIVVAHHWR